MFEHGGASAGEHSQVVFLVDGSGGSGPVLSALQDYGLPMLKYFRSSETVKEGEKQRRYEFSVVVFRGYFGTRSVLEILPFTGDINIVMQWIAGIEFEGGGSGVALGEGLAAALQLLTEKSTVADAGAQFCIVFCNNVPHPAAVMMSDSYAGKTCMELASEYGRFNINLSVVSPRRVDDLQQLFEEAGKHMADSSFRAMGALPAHMALIRGFTPPSFTHTARREAPTPSPHPQTPLLSKAITSSSTDLAGTTPPADFLFTAQNPGGMGSGAASTPGLSPGGRSTTPVFEMQSATLARRGSKGALPPQASSAAPQPQRRGSLKGTNTALSPAGAKREATTLAGPQPGNSVHKLWEGTLSWNPGRASVFASTSRADLPLASEWPATIAISGLQPHDPQNDVLCWQRDGHIVLHAPPDQPQAEMTLTSLLQNMESMQKATTIDLQNNRKLVLFATTLAGNQRKCFAYYSPALSTGSGQVPLTPPSSLTPQQQMVINQGRLLLQSKGVDASKYTDSQIFEVGLQSLQQAQQARQT